MGVWCISDDATSSVYSPSSFAEPPDTRLDIVMQPHRFEIVEKLGCQPAVASSALTIVLACPTPLVHAGFTLIYAGSQ